MNSENNLTIVLEILEAIESIYSHLDNEDNQMAVITFKGLENRLSALKSIYPKTHVISKIVDKIYTLHIGGLYQQIEADIELYEKEGISFDSGEVQ